jgi:phenylpropionate dioxygenase-like ring-hydroxylating dioxygenase large terminal subunit
VSKAFLFLSHQLTEDQEAELRAHWGVGEIVPLPQDLQALWSQVPPYLESLTGYLSPLFRWLAENARPGDIALIQGEFGAVYLAVQKAFELGLVPIYATTRREVRETKLPDGSIRQERVFKHVRFRVYGR